MDYLLPRGTVTDWGDDYGNRADRFLATTDYVDRRRSSLIMARGYFTRSVITAWDFRNGKLTLRWGFDSNASTNAGKGFDGQGSHNISVDDDGTGVWTTKTGHGDAQNLGDFDPDNPGAECWSVSDDSLRDLDGKVVGRKPSSVNFLTWWDGDTTRELLDSNRIDKYGTSSDTRLLTGSGVTVDTPPGCQFSRATFSATGARRLSGAPVTTPR